MGAVGAVLFGILLRGDPSTLGRLLPIATIVIGIVLLRLFA
jgi:quaternary ammonium compound-resistance protein SugE